MEVSTISYVLLFFWNYSFKVLTINHIVPGSFLTGTMSFPISLSLISCSPFNVDFLIKAEHVIDLLTSKFDFTGLLYVEEDADWSRIILMLKYRKKLQVLSHSVCVVWFRLCLVGVTPSFPADIFTLIIMAVCICTC